MAEWVSGTVIVERKQQLVENLCVCEVVEFCDYTSMKHTFSVTSVWNTFLYMVMCMCVCMLVLCATCWKSAVARLHCIDVPCTTLPEFVKNYCQITRHTGPHRSIFKWELKFTYLWTSVPVNLYPFTLHSSLIVTPNTCYYLYLFQHHISEYTILYITIPVSGSMYTMYEVQYDDDLPLLHESIMTQCSGIIVSWLYVCHWNSKD